MELAPFAVIEQVITRVLDGQGLRAALKDMTLTPQQFARMLQQDREGAVAYARATEMRADLVADEILEIADGPDDPNKARNRITARQWLASKWHAKRYGERIDLNVTQTLDIGSTLNEARARLLRPVRDQLTHEDAQVIDLPMRIATPAGDMASQSQASEPSAAARPLEPDIFS